jgi:hypothetical protein
MLALSLLLAHCDPSILENRSKAIHLATVLEVELSHAVEASSRAVLSDTGQASKLAADEAQRARASVLRDIDTLSATIQKLGYDEEMKWVEDFKAKFVAYDVLDRSILDLAVEKTNLNATRLSHGPLSDASDAFVRAALALASVQRKQDPWRARALAYQAIADVRELQALESPHIAEPKNEAMTRLEQRMEERIADARQVLTELESAVVAKEEVVPATKALESVVELHRQVIALSRKNTDVRALAMTLGQKRTLTASSREALRALSQALHKRVAGPVR